MKSMLNDFIGTREEAFLKIEACPDYREEHDKAKEIEKAIAEASPEHAIAIHDLHDHYFDAIASVMEEAYRVGILDGFRLVMELMGKA